jgi:hypothetical protein
MSESGVTRDGIVGARPDREASVGVNAGRRRRRSAEAMMVPDATFTSYYGKPIINRPVWKAPDIAGYLFLGGLAGASSVIAAAADITDRPGLARGMKVGAAGAISLGMVGLVHDLGRPARFLNMLRVFKPTSPMSVGSWALSAYGPAAAVAAGTAVTGRLPRVGAAASAGAAAVGPFIASYTAALIADTAVPAWHDGHREMPYLFVGSAASAAGGLALLTAPYDEVGPARAVALLGAASELASVKAMERRLGDVAEPYHSGVSGRLMRAAELVTVASAALSVVGVRSRWLGRIGGAGLLAASALTRFGIFEAGVASADRPQDTVKPQRERLERGEPARAPKSSR